MNQGCRTADRVASLVEHVIEGLGRFDPRIVPETFGSEAVWYEPATPPLPGVYRDRGRIARHVIDLAQLTNGTLTRTVQRIIPTESSAVAVCVTQGRVGSGAFAFGEILLFRVKDLTVVELWSCPTEVDLSTMVEPVLSTTLWAPFEPKAPELVDVVG